MFNKLVFESLKDLNLNPFQDSKKIILTDVDKFSYVELTFIHILVDISA